MEKFAEDDRIEQMNAQKRRMKQLEHKRAVEEIIQHRRDQHKVLRGLHQLALTIFQA